VGGEPSCVGDFGGPWAFLGGGGDPGGTSVGGVCRSHLAGFDNASPPRRRPCGPLSRACGMASALALAGAVPIPDGKSAPEDWLLFASEPLDVAALLAAGSPPAEAAVPRRPSSSDASAAAVLSWWASRLGPSASSGPSRVLRRITKKQRPSRSYVLRQLWAVSQSSRVSESSPKRPSRVGWASLPIAQ